MHKENPRKKVHQNRGWESNLKSKKKVKVTDSDSDENDDIVQLESDSESCSASVEEVEDGIKAGRDLVGPLQAREKT